jgi:hypothetical protein
MKTLALALLLVVLHFTTQLSLTQADDAAAASELAEADSEVTIDDIIAAWNARNDRVLSLHVAFSEDTIDVIRDIRTHRAHELSIEGLRYRHEADGERWNHNVEKPVPEFYLQMYDGSKDTTYFGYKEQIDRLHPFALIQVGDENHFSEAHANSVWPIFHTFRVQQPWFLSLGDGAWSLSGKVGIIDGHRCEIIQYRHRDQQGQLYDVWVDATRDYIALRKEMGSGGIVVSRLDIEYVPDDLMGWRPQRWSESMFSSGPGNELISTSNYEVTNWQFNEPVADNEFEFDFPVGTEVQDYSNGEYRYLVRDDEEREITEDERRRGARYEDWVVSESGEALQIPQSNTWRWIVGAIVLAVVGGWLIIKRR